MGQPSYFCDRSATEKENIKYSGSPYLCLTRSLTEVALLFILTNLRFGHFLHSVIILTNKNTIATSVTYVTLKKSSSNFRFHFYLENGVKFLPNRTRVNVLILKWRRIFLAQRVR